MGTLVQSNPTIVVESYTLEYFLVQKMERTKTKQEVQADFVQNCVLQIETYIMKPPLVVKVLRFYI